MKAYGLEVEENNNTKHNLNLTDTPTTSNPAVPATNNEGCTYLSLQEDERKKVEEVLFLMD